MLGAAKCEEEVISFVFATYFSTYNQVDKILYIVSGMTATSLMAHLMLLYSME